MNFADWYTDSMDVYRVVDSTVDNVTHSERTMVLENVPCRIYTGGGATPSFKRQAAETTQSQKVACDNSWDIRAGDELTIKRGFFIGQSGHTVRCFAGTPEYYYEPFGAVIPQLAHQQIPILEQERI